MAFASSALGVLSISEAKDELRIPSSESSLDGLIGGQIAAAVTYVTERVSKPLVTGTYRIILDRFPAEGVPIVIESEFVRHKGEISYWTDGSDLNGDPDGSISASDQGRLERRYNRHYLYWPDDGWPDDADSKAPVWVDHTRGWDVPEGVKQAVVLAARDYFEGQRIVTNSSIDFLLQPWLPYGHTRQQATPVVESTPTPTPDSGGTRYFGWSDDRSIVTADFADATTSGTNTGDLPARSDNGYIWFAVEEALGWPESLLIAGSPRNQISHYSRQSGTVGDADGHAHIVGISFDLQVAALGGEEVEIGFG